MKNSQKFTTPEERAEAFEKFCLEHICNKCQLEVACSHARGQFTWLDLEAEEEKLLPCPFCGNQCTCNVDDVEEWRVYCKTPGCYRSSVFDSKDRAIAAHNRVAHSVIEKENNNDKL